MIQEILQAFILIFIAEMGDKTQVLAMAFAVKYPVKKVLLGIMIGSFLNHGLAVVLGSQLTKIVPMNTIQIIAGIAFVCFGIWSLRIEEDEDEEEVSSKHGAVFTVALAFFIGELGDKTQLTAITLAAQSTFSLLILIGTVAGMVATGGLGIFVGKKIGDKIPEIGIKTVASIIFLFFGTTKLYNSLPKIYLNEMNLMLYLIVLVTTFFILFRKNYIIYKHGETKYRHATKALHEYYKTMEEKLDMLCRGEEKCGSCDGIKCPVGNTKAIVQYGNENDYELYKVIKYNSVEAKVFKKEIIDAIIEATTEVNEDVTDEEKEKLNKIISNMNHLNKK